MAVRCVAILAPLRKLPAVQTMASTSAVPVRESRIRPKHVVFAILAAMFLFVLWHDERFIIVHSHPNFAYYFPVRWFIIPHGLAGLAALLMGPFQLSTRFRQRHLQVHRIMGRFYLVAITIAALMGIYLAATHQAAAARQNVGVRPCGSLADYRPARI
jgi:hypothetical protein